VQATCEVKGAYWLVAGDPSHARVGVGLKMAAAVARTGAPCVLYLYGSKNQFLERVSTEDADWVAQLQTLYD
jgi:hypothetical protein